MFENESVGHWIEFRTFNLPSVSLIFSQNSQSLIGLTKLIALTKYIANSAYGGK